MSATRTTSSRASRGFTLIEVLMALLVLTVGLLGLLQSVNIAYQHTLRNRLRDQAALVAEEQLNALRINPALDPLTTVTLAVGGVPKKFSVSRETQPVGGDCNRLRVAVTWAYRNLSTTHEIYTLKKM